MGRGTVCVCGHSAGLHRGGKGICYMCACTVFDAHRPRIEQTEETQLALFEVAAHERARLYDVLCARGALGATHEELTQATGINTNSVRGRLSEMARDGDVVRTERRRECASGRDAGVYVVKAYSSAGRAAELRARLNAGGAL